MKEIKVSLKINTTQEFLDEKGTTLDVIRENIKFLGFIFGTKYLKLFPSEISSNDIEYISFYSNILRSIQDCKGFKEHINEYNVQNKGAHLYTARVTRFLLKKGYNVTLEPDMGKKDGPHPDLKIEKAGRICYVECKTSNISNYFRRDLKQWVANIIYDNISTPDQIDFFFNNPIKKEKIQKLFHDDKIINLVHSCFEHGTDGKETQLIIDKNLKINLIQRPAIIGDESLHQNIVLEMYMEDQSDNTRSIGYAFLKGGRSIGVYDVVDYSNKLKDKKEQSKKQLISGYPNLVFIRDSDVVGNPKLHKHYIENEWLTEELPECSGIVVFDVYDAPFQLVENENYKYYKNSNANFDFEISKVE